MENLYGTEPDEIRRGQDGVLARWQDLPSLVLAADRLIVEDSRIHSDLDLVSLARTANGVLAASGGLSTTSAVGFNVKTTRGLLDIDVDSRRRVPELEALRSVAEASYGLELTAGATKAVLESELGRLQVDLSTAESNGEPDLEIDLNLHLDVDSASAVEKRFGAAGDAEVMFSRILEVLS